MVCAIPSQDPLRGAEEPVFPSVVSGVGLGGGDVETLSTQMQALFEDSSNYGQATFVYLGTRKKEQF